jgi:hypothetical protein
LSYRVIARAQKSQCATHSVGGGAVPIFPSLQASRPNARDAARSELTQLDEQEPEVIVRHRDAEVRKAGA